jgi:transcription elongation factor GreA
MQRDPHLTQAKFEEMTRQLAGLKAVRPAVIAEVKRLAEMGDFSENAAYQLSKGHLRGINQRILELEDHLKLAEIIPIDGNSKTIQLGSTVIIEQAGKRQSYQILGPTETNPGKGIISHKSPLGAALMGKKVGEMAHLKIGGKEVEVKIVKVG